MERPGGAIETPRSADRRGAARPAAALGSACPAGRRGVEHRLLAERAAAASTAGEPPRRAQRVERVLAGQLYKLLVRLQVADAYAALRHPAVAGAHVRQARQCLGGLAHVLLVALRGRGAEPEPQRPGGAAPLQGLPEVGHLVVPALLRGVALDNHVQNADLPDLLEDLPEAARLIHLHDYVADLERILRVVRAPLVEQAVVPDVQDNRAGLVAGGVAHVEPQDLKWLSLDAHVEQIWGPRFPLRGGVRGGGRGAVGVRLDELPGLGGLEGARSAAHPAPGG